MTETEVMLLCAIKGSIVESNNDCDTIIGAVKTYQSETALTRHFLCAATESIEKNIKVSALINVGSENSLNQSPDKWSIFKDWLSSLLVNPKEKVCA